MDQIILENKLKLAKLYCAREGEVLDKFLNRSIGIGQSTLMENRVARR